MSMPPAAAASRRLRQEGRARPAGRRRARQLPGRGLCGPVGLGLPAGLGGRHLIGAINAAIIAGNAPERVRSCGNSGRASPHRPARWPAGGGRAWRSAGPTTAGSARRAPCCSASRASSPRPAAEWLCGARAGQPYDTTALKGTLEALVDFDRINAKEMRFSVGAVNVRTGIFAYFDNAESSSGRST